VSRRPEQRIDDIILGCEKILRYTARMDREAAGPTRLGLQRPR
jgi:hypothetical protein